MKYIWFSSHHLLQKDEMVNKIFKVSCFSLFDVSFDCAHYAKKIYILIMINAIFELWGNEFMNISDL